ncbi:hypothetical protein BCV71DRAFT_264297 [Rhizopus microsporus]|uniref:Uncharacterized protein n=1 Tax=Rhizopus microsporus TaxID=58291 RepID=A0A1X0S0V0_RHIZD|nr:hypothetical protein BCV71DRAFT_264297 [Rhizopus microsporus]
MLSALLDSISSLQLINRDVGYYYIWDIECACLSTQWASLLEQTHKNVTSRATFIAEEHNVNGNRDIFKAFQIHNILCHCQGPLLPVKNNTSSYAAQRQSERNENLDHEIIRIRSAMLARPNPVARIYRHA